MLIPLDYLMKKFQFKPKGILHLGANIGQEAEMYNKVGINHVIWVEAIQDVFEILQQNVEKYSNQICILACVGDENGKIVKFNISNNACESSSFLELGVHKDIHPTVEYVSSFNTEMVRIDKLLSTHTFGSGWMLNADLQGSELNAIKGMGEKINEFDYLYLELNKRETYKGCALVEEVDDYLHEFKRVETAKWVGDTWTDGFYIRKVKLN